MRSKAIVKAQGSVAALQTIKNLLMQASGGRLISSPILRNDFESGYRMYFTIEVQVEPLGVDRMEPESI